MPLPYLILALLYSFVGILAAADASLVSLNLFAAFPALRWVRVHFITLGVLSQIVFGALPVLAASLAGKPKPAMRWDIWLALNAGLVTLLAGFAGVNHPIIFAGGVLVFFAAGLLLLQLWDMRRGAPVSLKFYMTGVVYLLAGVLIGTGIWLNWSGPLRIAVPLEAHIHANSWGFLSLVFAGLLADFMPQITGRPLGTSRDFSLIYWGMTLGAFGLVFGPWLGGSLLPTAAGLILHLAATAWLVVLLGRALRAGRLLSSAGGWRLLSSYVWILLPVLVAPAVLFGVIESGPVEAAAPQALIYGWALQFGIAFVPCLARRFFLKDDSPRLGGDWFSLAGMTLGSAFVWVSIFLADMRGVLYGIGFVLYSLAMIPPLRELFAIARERWKQIE